MELPLETQYAIIIAEAIGALGIISFIAGFIFGYFLP